MHNTMVKIVKILLSFLVMTLSPFVIVVIWGSIYVIVQLINGLSLTASIWSFKAILLGLVPYFPYLTTVPIILILLAFTSKKGITFIRTLNPWRRF